MHINKLPDIWPAVVGIDLETTGFDWLDDHIVGIGISDGADTWILTEDFARIIPVMEDPAVVKVFHNFANFDGKFLYAIKPYTPVNIYDTQTIERVYTNSKYVDCDLEAVAARRVGVMLNKDIRKTFENHTGDMTPEQLEYLKNDVLYLPEIRQQQIRDMHTREMDKILDLETRLIPVTFEMVISGVGVDPERYAQITEEINTVLDRVRSELNAALGEDFYIEVMRASKKVKGTKEKIKLMVDEINLNSHDQLETLLHKRGFNVPNTQGETLMRYAGNPVIDLILDYKKWRMLRRIKWIEHVKEQTGRIHAHHKQEGTVTGRYAVKEPPLQQADRPKPGYPVVRSIFTPMPGHVFVVCDWSQQEPRILAHVSMDRAMREAANANDIYCAYGKIVYGEDITKADPRRQRMKIGVLSLFYGDWAGNLAITMGVSLKEAEAFVRKVFFAFPAARNWGDLQGKAVRNFGFTRSVWKRYMPFSEQELRLKWKVDKEARNYPIQGTGADMAKLALCNLYDRFHSQGYDARILIGMHDEIVVSAHPDCADQVLADMIEIMEAAGREMCPSVRFPVEGGIYDTWKH